MKEITHKTLENELTPEQYRRFLEIEEKLGIQDAVDDLPELMDTETTSIADIMNDILKRVRIDHGLTQNDLANILGVSRQKYNCYERSGYNVSVSRMARIASFYNISLDCLSGRYWEYKPFYPNLPKGESEVIKFIIDNKENVETLPDTEALFNEIFSSVKKQ